MNKLQMIKRLSLMNGNGNITIQIGSRVLEYRIKSVTYAGIPSLDIIIQTEDEPCLVGIPKGSEQLPISPNSQSAKKRQGERGVDPYGFPYDYGEVRITE